MNGKSQSILLQVAFKEAANWEKPVQEIEERTLQYFELLLALHSKLGIDADEGAAPARRTFTGGNRAGGSANRGTTSAAPKEDPSTSFFFGDRIVKDYRDAKASGAVKGTHPDFKSLDNQALPGGSVDREGNVTGSVWLLDRDDQVNEEAMVLVTAADGVAVG